MQANRTTHWLLAGAALAAAAVALGGEDAPTLRVVAPDAGASFVQTLSMTETGWSGDSEEPFSKASTKIVHDVLVRPAAEDAPQQRIVGVYERSRVEAQSDIGAGEFDSKTGDPLDQQVLEAAIMKDVGVYYALSFAFMGRQTVGLDLQPDGAASVTSGLAPVRKWIAGKRSSGFGPSLIEDAAMRPDLLFAYVGEGPHDVGATWEREWVWVAPVPGPKVRADVAYRVESVTREHVVVAFSGEPSLVLEWGDVSADDRSAVSERIIKTTLRGTTLDAGSFSGKATISRADGLPLSMSWTLDVTRRFPTLLGKFKATTRLSMELARKKPE